MRASPPGPLRLDEDDDDDICIRADILFARRFRVKGGGGIQVLEMYARHPLGGISMLIINVP